MKLIGLNFGKL